MLTKQLSENPLYNMSSMPLEKRDAVHDLPFDNF